MPDHNGKPKRAYRRTSETQQIIFDAAMRLMSEKGFQGTTVRDICAEAGVPIGTFYNCYRSKIEILKRIYDAGDAYIQTDSHDHDLGALDMLRAFAERYARLNEQTGIDVLRVLFYPSNEWFSIERPMQLYVRRFVEEGQRRGELRADLTADEIVLSLFDILRGVCYNWCVCDGDFDLGGRIAFHMELFCASIQIKN
ncbi:MAG: TetR/AcrR family transcriptional regulator [Lachnospiraceae bacterium]|nr:TetR/AcrR family transcriptional regulator [Lachnospiraceae bacterium]